LMSIGHVYQKIQTPLFFLRIPNIHRVPTTLRALSVET
jgi:hypothetical protein